jgi:hypothetical protein
MPLENSKAKPYYAAAIEVAKAITKSGVLKNELESLRMEQKLIHKSVITFSQTRWADVFFVAQRYLELWNQLVQLGTDGIFDEYAIESKKVPWQAPEAKHHLLACQEVLKVFADGIKDLEGEKYPTLCRVPYSSRNGGVYCSCWC